MLCLICLRFFHPEPAANSKPYGVFIGLETADLKRLRPYRTVVIEPSTFTAEQIKTLQAEGKSVYGYLNLGSLENYRPYYARFANLTLTPYENWPEERWVDVSSPAWQTFVVDELGAAYAALGLDGFFLDNCDVYALYPREDIFSGLTTMLRGLSRYQKPCIVNGGDVFVSACTENGTARTLFDGVNQESVFTKIDFAKNRYAAQDTETRSYYLNYLTRAKEAGLKVYLIEYRPSAKLAADIQDYCEKNGFVAYLANEKELR
jgi:conserved hypothetical protein